MATLKRASKYPVVKAEVINDGILEFDCPESIVLADNDTVRVLAEEINPRRKTMKFTYDSVLVKKHQGVKKVQVKLNKPMNKSLKYSIEIPTRTKTRKSIMLAKLFSDDD